MPTTRSSQASPRAAGGRRAAAARPFYEVGLPDPRPVTGYSVAVSTNLGNTQVTITLDQPCVIREPNWAFINCSTGARVYAETVMVQDTRTFFFHFNGLLNTAVAFVEVPYQDMQVQNYQGGFVRPGAQWFRKPV